MALLAKSPWRAEEAEMGDVSTFDIGVRPSGPSDRAWLGQDGEQVMVSSCWCESAFVGGRRRMMRGVASSGIPAVWKRAVPRNRMREILTSGSVGGLAEQSLALPGRDIRCTHVTPPWADIGLARWAEKLPSRQSPLTENRNASDPANHHVYPTFSICQAGGVKPPVANCTAANRPRAPTHTRCVGPPGLNSLFLGHPVARATG